MHACEVENRALITCEFAQLARQDRGEQTREAHEMKTLLETKGMDCFNA